MKLNDLEINSSSNIKEIEEKYITQLNKKDKVIQQLQHYKSLICEELKVIKQVIQNLNYK
jgi:hypothetical protein